MYDSYIAALGEGVILTNTTVDVRVKGTGYEIETYDTTIDSYKLDNAESILHRLVLRVEEGSDPTIPYAVDLFQYNGISRVTEWKFFTTNRFTRLHLTSNRSDNNLVEGLLYYTDQTNDMETAIEILPTAPETIFFLQKELLFPIS